MERYAQRSHAELGIQTKLLEAEEILTDVFGEVSTGKLFAVIVEGSNTVLANLLRVKSRSLIDISI